VPKIHDLPPALRDHLFERLRERKITAEDPRPIRGFRFCLTPQRYKDFGSFKVCGEGKYPKTFLLRGQPAKGEKL
jgi:hypothetical protein